MTTRWIIRPVAAVALAVVAPAGAAGAAGAQSPVGTARPVQEPVATLGIEEAVALATRNNPDYLQTVNNRRSAAAARRAAGGGFLPQVSATLGAQFQQGGQQPLNGVALGASSDVLQSTYNIGVSYRLSQGTFITPRLQQANSEAVEGDVAAARENLRATVRQQYLTALQDQARVALQDSLVANARLQVELARGRAAVGTGTGLDVQRAEVAQGQQEVARLRAQNQLAVDQLRLYQTIGLPAPDSVTLTSTFTLDTSPPALPALLALARAYNPGLAALRSRERGAALNVGLARSEYTPTLLLSTGIGGYTYAYRDAGLLVDQQRAAFDQQRAACVALQETRAAAGLPNSLSECAAIALTPAQAAAIRSGNDRFPFGFTKAPRSVSAQLSLPLFDGFAREQRVQEARVQREGAAYARRSRELALTADVTAAHLTLRAALRTIALQERNAAAARQQLQFVQDQYGVGLATFVDLQTARATYEQAEGDRITAVYDYHKAFAALESAVGRPLK